MIKNIAPASNEQIAAWEIWDTHHNSHDDVELIFSALIARIRLLESAQTAPAEVVAGWRCEECRCHSYAVVQDVNCNPTNQVRCVNCKHVTTLSTPTQAEARADLADADAKKLADRWQNEVGLREEMERRYSGILERAELAERERASLEYRLDEMTVDRDRWQAAHDQNESRILSTLAKATPADEMVEPLADMLLYERPQKIIDASIAFIEAAPIGTKLYAHPPAPSEQISGEAVERVTEAMVERATREYWAKWFEAWTLLGEPKIYPYDEAPEKAKEQTRACIRAALEAALEPRHD